MACGQKLRLLFRRCCCTRQCCRGIVQPQHDRSARDPERAWSASAADLCCACVWPAMAMRWGPGADAADRFGTVATRLRRAESGAWMADQERGAHAPRLACRCSRAHASRWRSGRTSGIKLQHSDGSEWEPCLVHLVVQPCSIGRCLILHGRIGSDSVQLLACLGPAGAFVPPVWPSLLALSRGK